MWRFYIGFHDIHVHRRIPIIHRGNEGIKSNVAQTLILSSLTYSDGIKDMFYSVSNSCLVQVFYKERLNGYYGIAVYILSNFLSSFPFIAVMSFATGSITYYMVKFRSEFSHLLYICLDLLGCIAVVESSMMIIAALVPNFLMGLIIGAGYIVSVPSAFIF